MLDLDLASTQLPCSMSTLPAVALARELESLPQWLCLCITSRPEQEVMTRLRLYSAGSLMLTCNSEENQHVSRSN